MTSGRWRLGGWVLSGFIGRFEGGEFFERGKRERAEHAGETASGGNGGRFAIDAFEHPFELSRDLTVVEIKFAHDLRGRPEEIALDDVEQFVIGRLVIQDHAVFWSGENISLLAEDRLAIFI